MADNEIPSSENVYDMSAWTEHEAIQQLQDLITALEMRGVNMASAVRFLDVGEWLICFEGIEQAIEAHQINDDWIKCCAARIRHYFETKPQPIPMRPNDPIPPTRPYVEQARTQCTYA